MLHSRLVTFIVGGFVTSVTIMRKQYDGLSNTVIYAISNYEDVEPAEIDPPLSEVIDLEALDSLFLPMGSDDHTVGSVRFKYKGFEIVVHSDGRVSVNE